MLSGARNFMDILLSFENPEAAVGGSIDVVGVQENMTASSDGREFLPVWTVAGRTPLQKRSGNGGNVFSAYPVILIINKIIYFSQKMNSAESFWNFPSSPG